NFTDTVGHWAEDQIGYLKGQKITGGLPDGSFGDNNHISRAKTAALLVRALKLDTEVNQDLNFPDVSKNHYFYKSIAAVSSNGIMQGTPNGKFNPDKTLTRAEMASLLVNAFGLENKGEVTFPDVSKGHWAYEDISILASNSL